MKRRFQVAALALVLATGLAAAPTRGADDTHDRAPPQAPDGAERWRLRPSQAALGPDEAGPPARDAARPIPEARRSVRLVYPALLADR
ncbi:hypothetical protein [Methylobacterium sp. A54F]